MNPTEYKLRPHKRTFYLNYESNNYRNECQIERNQRVKHYAKHRLTTFFFYQKKYCNRQNLDYQGTTKSITKSV